MGQYSKATKMGEKAALVRLDALTGLRFLAAAHVMVFHCGLSQLPQAPEWAKNIATHADMSVSLFFVLSGFILTYTYFDLNKGLRTSKRQFYLARFARVYPIYLLGLLVSLPFFLAEGVTNNTWSAVVGKIGVAGLVVLLLQAWLPQTVMAWNFPSWSLSNEAFFYYSFPWLVEGKQLQSRWRLIVTMGLLWLIGQLPPMVVQIAGPEGLGYLDAEAMGSWRLVAQANPLIRLIDFTIGILVGRLWLQDRGAQTGKTPNSGWLSIAALTAIVAIMSYSATYPFPLAESRSLLAPLNALMIYGLAKEGGPLTWLLSRPGFILLGNASYALYLLHVPIAKWMERATSSLGISDPYTWPFFFVVTATAIGFSVAAFLWVEEPARRWLRRLA